MRSTRSLIAAAVAALALPMGAYAQAGGSTTPSAAVGSAASAPDASKPDGQRSTKLQDKAPQGTGTVQGDAPKSRDAVKQEASQAQRSGDAPRGERTTRDQDKGPQKGPDNAKPDQTKSSRSASAPGSAASGQPRGQRSTPQQDKGGGRSY